MSDRTERTRRSPSRKFLTITAGLVAALIAIVLVSVLTGGSVNNGKVLPTSDLVGRQLKTFSLDGLYGGTEVAPWQHHHASVVVFFASWCPPCQGEIPKVVKYLHTHDLGDVHVLGVDGGDPRGAAKAFVKKDDVTFPIAYDYYDNVTSGVFSLGDLPDTVFVNARGVVTKVVLGAISDQALAAGIEQLRQA